MFPNRSNHNVWELPQFENLREFLDELSITADEQLAFAEDIMGIVRDIETEIELLIAG